MKRRVLIAGSCREFDLDVSEWGSAEGSVALARFRTSSVKLDRSRRWRLVLEVDE